MASGNNRYKKVPIVVTNFVFLTYLQLFLFLMLYDEKNSSTIIGI